MRRPPNAPHPHPPGRPELRRASGIPKTGSLGAWLLEASERFSVAGVGSTRSDAQRLAAHALRLDWGDLWTRLRAPLDPEVAAELERLAARRSAREPLAYILGSTEFYGLEIRVGPGVLVPRPETEVLVDIALDLIEDISDPVVVDVGTGSGAIALAIVSERADARVLATDLSGEALAFARGNGASLALQVEWLEGDALAPLPQSLRGEIDLIVSNPPYVPNGRSDLLDPDVLAEPHEALFAGPQGDEMLLRLIRESPAWLAPEGALALEVGTPDQALSTVEAVVAWSEQGVEDDLTERPRVVWARR